MEEQEKRNKAEIDKLKSNLNGELSETITKMRIQNEREINAIKAQN